ncbi:peptidylprolyl isomerase [Blautia hydrogenotrophica]|uniref:peptidylprolyl isomerase n=1 Tax=Blautia hydrogenotrophica TaxID=53443 RepID=UPI0023F042B2|nr:hypothetical protein [Blautia hydrogenotrophica]
MEDEKKGTTYGDSLRDDALEQLEEMCLLKIHADEYEVTVTKEEQEKIQRAAKQFMEDNSEEVKSELVVSQKDVERFLELTTYYQKMQEPIKADADMNVTDEEAAQTTVTYTKVDPPDTEATTDEEKEDSGQEEKDAKTKAQEILDQVLATEDADMDAIAKSVDEDLSALSESFSTNEAEEEEDETDTSTGNLPDAVKEAVKGLQDGEVVSSLIQDGDSYYVVRLDSAFDQEATENQKDSIISERKQELYDDTVEEWRDKADISEDKKAIKKLKVKGNHKFTFKAEEAESTGAGDGASENAENSEASE